MEEIVLCFIFHYLLGNIHAHDHRHLAMKLKHYRKARGLTQGQLAQKVGLSLGYIARLEEIGMHDPPLSTVAKLAKALKVTVAELVK